MTAPTGDWRDRIGADLRRHEQERPPEGAASAGGRLGRYELGEPLGEGAAAIVRRAVDLELGRQVAIKILREPAASIPSVRERFKQEGRIAASLSHPNVLAVHDVGEAEGRLYLVTELIDGHPLSDLLRQARRDLQPMVVLLEKAARGVSAAHERGIVHRDLKPGNILVTADGEPKVADFGLARALDSEAGLTRTGTVLGTPLYMAPEQIRGRPDLISARTDVYALGAILYEILAGRPPHTGDAVSEIFGKILNEEPVAPGRLNGRVPVDLETVALKAIEKDPSRRYADAREFGAELRRFLDGEPILAKPPGPVSRALKAARRHRAVSASVAVGFSCLVLWAAYATAEARRLARAQDAMKLLDTARPAVEAAWQARYRAIPDAGLVTSQVAKVRPLIDEALAKAPDFAPCHYLDGRAWLLLGRDDLAEKAWRRTVALDPGYGPGHYLLGRLIAERYYLEIVGTSLEDHAARKAAARGLADEAGRELEAAIRSRSGFDDELQRVVARALLAYSRGDDAGAVAIAEQELPRFENQTGVEDLLWIAGLCSPEPKRSAYYGQALAVCPGAAVVLAGRGCERAKALRFAEAIRDLDLAILLRPGIAMAWVARGGSRLATGDKAGARGDLEQALRLDPKLATAHAALGFLRENTGDRAGALASFGEALRLEPHLVSALATRGNLRLIENDLDGASADLDAAIALEPGHYKAIADRGRVRTLQQRWKEAVEDMEKALSLAPADWSNRARAQKFMDEARARLREH